MKPVNTLSGGSNGAMKARAKNESYDRNTIDPVTCIVTLLLLQYSFSDNCASSENRQKTNVKPVITKTRKRSQRGISNGSTIYSTSHLADKYTDAMSKEQSSQFELLLLLLEAREVGGSSLYRADLSVVGQSRQSQLQETYSRQPSALAMAC